jgi:cytoskeletal protein CcmA (bactofilin family)
MAWFDRGPGDKGDGKDAAEKPAPAVTLTTLLEKGIEPAKPVVKAALTAPEPTGEFGLVGHLYKGSRVTGQLVFQGAARIDGNVEGEIQCHGILTIGDSAEVRAKISSRVVVICGKVEGNVSAREKVELVSPARVVGTISTPRLTVTEGVIFDGDCAMGSGKQKTAVASAQAKGADGAVPASTPPPQSE